MRGFILQRIQAAQLLKQTRPWLFWCSVVAGLFLITYVIYVFFSGLDNGLFFQGYAADGSFQIYNPLRRMAAGELPGRDFQYFHGIGIPLLLYPLFKLLGANLFASEVTRWYVCLIVFVVTTGTFLRLITRSWYRTVIALSLTMVLLAYFANPLLSPGNSLMGLRTAAPLLVASLLAVRHDWRRPIGRYSLSLQSCLLWISLALALFFSTEHGIYAIAAYFVYRLCLLGQPRRWRLSALACLAGEGLIIITLILLLFTVFTAGHPLPPLVYALKTIPAEQFWYFGAPPNTFLGWTNVPHIIIGLYQVFLIIAVAVVLYRAASRRQLLDSASKRAFGFLSIYALFSCASALGYISLSQFFPLIKVALTIIAALGILLMDPVATRKRLPPPTVLLRILRYGVIVLFVVAIGITAHRVNQFHLKTLLVRAVTSHHNPDSSVITPTGWATALNTFSQLQGVKQGQLWSTYSTLYESNAGIFQPSDSDFDYIIHALGPKNFNSYVQQFTKQQPKYVITLRPDYFDYEEWLWTSNWAFYRQLLSHYTIINVDASHYLWQYTGDVSDGNGPWHTLPVKNNGVTLPKADAKPTVYEVQVQYKATTPLGLLHKLPRYLLQPQDTGLKYAISVPPYQQTWTFPVPVYPNNQAPHLQATSGGIVPDSHLQMQSVRYRILNIPEADRAPFTNNNMLCPFKADAINNIYATCLQYR